MRLLLLAALAGLLLAGCTAKPADTSGTDTPGPKTMSMPAPVKTVGVDMVGSKFKNETVTIYAGDSVKWTNQDMVGHSVKADSGATLDNKPNCMSGLEPAPLCMGKGESTTWASTQVGDVAYHCPAHAMTMKGTIHVVARPTVNMTM